MGKTINWLLLVVIAIGLICLFYFHLYDFCSFSALKRYRTILLALVATHYTLTVCCYALIYILAVALSFPAATFMALVGGFMFGPVAVFYVVFCATLGSTILFAIVSSTIGSWFAGKARGWLAKMEKNFQLNAFNYLLFLRLVPIVPFWVVNISASLLAVRMRVFVLATFLGIIPAKIIYVMMGNALNTIFDDKMSLSFTSIFTPTVLLSLLGLGLLALLPVLIKNK